jgi:hypothetical protein
MEPHGFETCVSPRLWVDPDHVCGWVSTQSGRQSAFAAKLPLSASPSSDRNGSKTAIRSGLFPNRWWGRTTTAAIGSVNGHHGQLERPLLDGRDRQIHRASVLRKQLVVSYLAIGQEPGRNSLDRGPGAP